MHEDLFAQAETLAQIDPKRPKQVNLRRAVSSTYYAVFHYLIHEACCLQLGGQRAQSPFRNVLGRAFSHASMKSACISFGGGTLRSSVIKGLPLDATGNYRIEVEIRGLASAFVNLQELRHMADYDRSEKFKRLDVLTFIDEARERVADFASLPLSDGKKFFLACLWAWKELANR